MTLPPIIMLQSKNGCISVYEFPFCFGVVFHFHEYGRNTRYTLPKTNMEPENHMFEKENHLPNLHDYGPC